MTTALDLITQARQILNIDAVGDSISAPEAAASLKVFNQMLDNWSNQKIAVYYTQSDLLPLAGGGINPYTIGLSDRVIQGNSGIWTGGSIAVTVNGISTTQPILFMSETAAWYGSNDPVLLAGQIGWENNSHDWKIGDGISDYATLAYQSTLLLPAAAQLLGRSTTMAALANTMKLALNQYCSNVSYNGTTDALTLSNNGAGVLSVSVVFSNAGGGDTQTYSLTALPSSHLETQRPLRIETAFTRMNVTGTNIDYVIKIINNEQYQNLALKNVSVTYPDMLYYQPSFPFGNLYFYGVPGSGLYLGLTQTLQLIKLANLNTQISLPPGYELAMQYNLAIHLAPRYGRSDKCLPGSLIHILAMETFADIQRTNSDIVHSSQDSFFANQGGRYNIYSDSFNTQGW